MMTGQHYLQQLNMGQAFAQGALGRLYRRTYNGDEVAVKILERPENNIEKAMVMESAFAKEVMMLATVKHQNVVRFVGACWKPLVWYIVTEYAKHGSVRLFLCRWQSWAVPLKLAVKQALGIARGMKYLHSLDIIHRGLKSDNLLIATDKSIKIADFGAARIEVQVEEMTPETGTYRWMAPEMIQDRSYNHKVDIYSFGIILWELIPGSLVFQNMTVVQTVFAVVNQGVRPPSPSCLSSSTGRNYVADAHPSFILVVKLFEPAQEEIMTTVCSARFQGCWCLAWAL